MKRNDEIDEAIITVVRTRYMDLVASDISFISTVRHVSRQIYRQIDRQRDTQLDIHF